MFRFVSLEDPDLSLNYISFSYSNDWATQRLCFKYSNFDAYTALSNSEQPNRRISTTFLYCVSCFLVAVLKHIVVIFNSLKLLHPLCTGLQPPCSIAFQTHHRI
ncbi:hypothetical protein EDC96DRAFT_548835 [Choanephora cucurbitarum]|nr:hypothetical protein EDC96DRAFT_548835 [Choanephora cucurbitarum]